MKKFVITTIVLTIVFNNIPSMAAVVAVPDGKSATNSDASIINNIEESSHYNEEESYFGFITNHGETTYITSHYQSNGGFVWMDGNVETSFLPYGMMNEGVIYTACCYGNKIYYSTGVDGSDIDMPTKIYSCDMNGQNNVLLADNAVAYNDAIIVDNVLYYQEYRSYVDYGVQGYNGGISKINLNDLSWQKLVDGNVSMSYCDGEYVYYVNNNNNMHCAIDINGQNVVEMNPYIDEFTYHFIKDDKVYYLSGNAIYEKDLNYWKQKKIATVPYNSEICNVSDDYIYYVAASSYTSPLTATIYRVHR